MDMNCIVLTEKPLLDCEGQPLYIKHERFLNELHNAKSQALESHVQGCFLLDVESHFSVNNTVFPCVAENENPIVSFLIYVRKTDVSFTFEMLISQSLQSMRPYFKT